MKLSQLLRGLIRVETVTGTTNTVVRIPRRELRGPVERVLIKYTPVSLQRTKLLPFPHGIDTTIWFMRVECRTLDGQRLYQDVASDKPLKQALDYAYLKGMHSAVIKLAQQLQAA
jgi:hypothetical protein